MRRGKETRGSERGGTPEPPSPSSSSSFSSSSASPEGSPEKRRETHPEEGGAAPGVTPKAAPSPGARPIPCGVDRHPRPHSRGPPKGSAHPWVPPAEPVQGVKWGIKMKKKKIPDKSQMSPLERGFPAGVRPGCEHPWVEQRGAQRDRSGDTCGGTEGTRGWHEVAFPLGRAGWVRGKGMVPAGWHCPGGVTPPAGWHCQKSDAAREVTLPQQGGTTGRVILPRWDDTTRGVALPHSEVTLPVG